MADVMLFCEPLKGRREAWVIDRRTKTDFAHAMERIGEAYPEAEVIRVVMDNLNTHKLGSFYDTFPPTKLEFHYTPKHGSWLYMAGIEFSVLSRQCLNRRTPDVDTLAKLVDNWKTTRNQSGQPMRWQFTSDKTRKTMARCYPSQPSG